MWAPQTIKPLAGLLVCEGIIQPEEQQVNRSSIRGL